MIAFGLWCVWTWLVARITFRVWGVIMADYWRGRQAAERFLEHNAYLLLFGATPTPPPGMAPLLFVAAAIWIAGIVGIEYLIGGIG